MFNKSEEYEERRETVIRDFPQIKASEFKMQLISLIDAIEKLCSCEQRFVEDTIVSLFAMNEKQIQYFNQLLHQNNERVQKYKLNLLGKVLKNRVTDFSYNFNIRYAETNSEKVEFGIRIVIKYINDEGKDDKIDMDLTINQFYGIFNEFQKIDTMVKTLAG